MIKSKVGEIWLVDSTFTWKKCLVLITETNKKEKRFKGFILDAAKEKGETEIDIEADLDMNYEWNFDLSWGDKFIRRVNEKEKCMG